MVEADDIVRLSNTLFPPGDTTEERWNNRIVRVVELKLHEILTDNSVWRVEPLYMDNEDDYIHVHAYEMSPAYDKEYTTSETDENV